MTDEIALSLLMSRGRRAWYLTHLEAHVGSEAALGGMAAQQGSEGVSVLALLAAPLLPHLRLSFRLNGLQLPAQSRSQTSIS